MYMVHANSVSLWQLWLSALRSVSNGTIAITRFSLFCMHDPWRLTGKHVSNVFAVKAYLQSLNTHSMITPWKESQMHTCPNESLILATPSSTGGVWFILSSIICGREWEWDRGGGVGRENGFCMLMHANMYADRNVAMVHSMHILCLT